MKDEGEIDLDWVLYGEKSPRPRSMRHSLLGLVNNSDLGTTVSPMTSNETGDREYRRLVGAEPIPELQLFDVDGDPTEICVRIVDEKSKPVQFTLNLKEHNIEVDLGKKTFWLKGPGHEPGMCVRFSNHSGGREHLLLLEVKGPNSSGVWTFRCMNLENGEVRIVSSSDFNGYTQPDDLMRILRSHKKFDLLKEFIDWMESLSERDRQFNYPMDKYRLDPEKMKDVQKEKSRYRGQW